MVHKKEKTFGLNELLGREWYPEDLPLDIFKNSSYNEKDNILILPEKDQEEILLEFSSFYEDIDLQEGFSIRNLSKILSIN